MTCAHTHTSGSFLSHANFRIARFECAQASKKCHMRACEVTWAESSMCWSSLTLPLTLSCCTSLAAGFVSFCWKKSVAEGKRKCKVVNRCFVFCDQLCLNIDLSHRKMLCINRVSDILINLFHRRIISMWRLTLTVYHMSPDTAKFGACLWTPRQMRMARYCIVSNLGISGYPQTAEL